MRWRCLGEVAEQLGNEDEAVTNPKPYDIPERRMLEDCVPALPLGDDGTVSTGGVYC